MADYLTPATLPPTVVAYLCSIETRIPRWRRARRALVAELASGLEDAVQHYVEHGMTAEQAATRAIQDSGPAPVVAEAFSTVLAAGQARLAATALLLSGPLLGLLWLKTLVPGQWPSALLLNNPGVGMLVLTAALFSGLTLVGGDLGVDRSALSGRQPRCVAIACTSTALCDLWLLVSAGALLTHGAGLGTSGALAGTISLIRLVLTQRVARRDLAAPTTTF